MKVTLNGGDNQCVCGFIHPCCRYLIDDGCPHQTPGDHKHAPVPEPEIARVAVIDATLLDRQRTWSENTFGPYPRLAGVVDHIRRELVEVVESGGDLSEWVDVIMLAFDGACGSGASSQAIIEAFAAKLKVNEARTWPDWRTADRSKAIEHVRTCEHCPHNPHNGMCGKRVEVNTYCACFGKPR